MPNIYGGRGLPLYSNQKLLYDMSLYNQYQYPPLVGVVSSSEVNSASGQDQDVNNMLHTYAAIEGFNYNDATTILMPAISEGETELYETESNANNAASKQLSPDAVEFTPSNQVSV